MARLSTICQNIKKPQWFSPGVYSEKSSRMRSQKFPRAKKVKLVDDPILARWNLGNPVWIAVRTLAGNISSLGPCSVSMLIAQKKDTC
jgi:hypothetical protein